MPRTIFAIATNTLREAVRDRVLYNLILFVLLITASAVFLGELTAGQEARVIADLGLSASLVFGTFIAIFVGVSLVWKEIEKKTVCAIFSKPVGRAEFVIGKYLGLCATLLVNVIVMGLGITLAEFYVGGSRFIAPVWTSLLLIFLELSVTTAVAILFSSFSTPALSALLTFFIFLIGHFSSSLREFAEHLGSSGAIAFFTAVYYALPNLAHFSFVANAANAETAPGWYVGSAALYALVADGTLMAITVLIFSRRNFK